MLKSNLSSDAVSPTLANEITCRFYVLAKSEREAERKGGFFRSMTLLNSESRLVTCEVTFSRGEAKGASEAKGAVRSETELTASPEGGVFWRGAKTFSC